MAVFYIVASRGKAELKSLSELSQDVRSLFRLIPAHRVLNGRTLIVFVTRGKGSKKEETGSGEAGGKEIQEE